jgi:uncharacterized protein
MKIGVFSDTHDQTRRIEKAVSIMNKEKVGLAIHCGDIVAPFVLQSFNKIKCPIKFLFGNNTGDIFLHMKFAEKFGLRNYDFGNFFSIEADGKKIAVYHGDIMEVTEALIKCGDYDCVFAGHDHFARTEKRGQVLFLNPGTLTDKHKEGMKPPSIAIYDTKTHSARIINV